MTKQLFMLFLAIALPTFAKAQGLPTKYLNNKSYREDSAYFSRLLEEVLNEVDKDTAKPSEFDTQALRSFLRTSGLRFLWSNGEAQTRSGLYVNIMYVAADKALVLNVNHFGENDLARSRTSPITKKIHLLRALADLAGVPSAYAHSGAILRYLIKESSIRGMVSADQQTLSFSGTSQVPLQVSTQGGWSLLVVNVDAGLGCDFFNLAEKGKVVATYAYTSRTNKKGGVKKEDEKAGRTLIPDGQRPQYWSYRFRTGIYEEPAIRTETLSDVFYSHYDQYGHSIHRNYVHAMTCYLPTMPVYAF